MSGDHVGLSSVESCPKYHTLQRQRRGDNASPPLGSQSLPVTPAKQLRHSYQQQQQPQSPLYSSPTQNRAFSTMQLGSPAMYRVSPIAKENSSEMPPFNPQSPYRSTAPSRSRLFDSLTFTSPDEQMRRKMGPDVASSSSSCSSPAPQFRRAVTTSQSCASQHSQGVVMHPSQQGSSQLSDGPTNEVGQASAASESGFTAVLTKTNLQRSTNSPQTTQHYLSGMASATMEDMSSLYPEKSMRGAMLASPLMPGGGRPHFSSSLSNDGWSQQQQQQVSIGAPRSSLTGAANGISCAASGAAMTGALARRSTSPGSSASSLTILQGKQPENVSPADNSALEGRIPSSPFYPSSQMSESLQSKAAPSDLVTGQFSLPPPQPPLREHAASSPPRREATPFADLPSHTGAEGGTNGPHATESGERWVSPQRPPRETSTSSSNGFQSPISAPSSNGTSITMGPPQRSPAMYGVIGLPYTRGDSTAGGTAAARGRNGHNTITNAKLVSFNPVMQFHAVPKSSSSPTSSSSGAPTIINVRSPGQSGQQRQQQQQAEHRGDAYESHRHHPHDGAREAKSAAMSHVDPDAAAIGAPSGTAAVPVHPSSGSNELSALYRMSMITRHAHSINDSTSVSRGDSSAEPSDSVAGQATGTPCSTPSPPLPPHSVSDDEHEMRQDEKEGLPQAEQRKQQKQQQHITSVAPAAVVAARARLPVSHAAPAAVVEAVQKLQKRFPNALLNGTAAATANRKAPSQLTADTVLPVAAQEEELCFSSSTTDTIERSSSSTQQQTAAVVATPSTSSKSSVMAAPTPLSSGRARKVSQASSDFSNGAARQQRGSTKPSPLSTTHSGSGSPMMTRVTAVSVSSDVNDLTSSVSTHCRRESVSFASASSDKSTTLMLAGCSFVSCRTHLQHYIDQWRDRFEEDKNAYKEGGYLTVTPGKIVRSRYVLIQKLGWGEFSTVWLAYDSKHATLGRGATQAFVAVKVAKCRTSVQEATHYEVSLLRYLAACLPKHAAVTNIIDCFDVEGEFGTHICMVMPLCGPNLLSIIDRVKGQRGRRSADDVRLVKEILISVLISLHELSVLNVVHTDIKPENVLCCAVDTKLMNLMEKFCNYNKDRSHMISADQFRAAMAQQTSNHLVCLADFGLSALLEPPGSVAMWTAKCPKIKPSLLAPLMRCKKNFNVTKPGVMENLRGTLIQTREYRAPEVLLGLDFTCTTDVWSVGCMAFELLTGNFLMDPKKKTRDAREMDVEHLAMIMQLIGPLPPEITDIRVRNNDYYEAVIKGTPVPRRTGPPPPEYLHRFVDKEGNFIYASRYRAYPRRCLEMELESYLGFREARLAANFILSCLYCYDPKHRPSAKKLLAHPWFHNMGTPNKERSNFR